MHFVSVMQKYNQYTCVGGSVHLHQSARHLLYCAEMFASRLAVQNSHQFTSVFTTVGGNIRYDEQICSLIALRNVGQPAKWSKTNKVNNNNKNKNNRYASCRNMSWSV